MPDWIAEMEQEIEDLAERCYDENGYFMGNEFLAGKKEIQESYYNLYCPERGELRSWYYEMCH